MTSAYWYLDVQRSIRPLTFIRKGFTEPRQWCQLLYLNNLVNPEALWSSQCAGEYWLKQLGAQYKSKLGIKDTAAEAPDIRGHVLHKFKTKPAKSKLVKGLKASHKVVAVAEAIPPAFQALDYSMTKLATSPHIFGTTGKEQSLNIAATRTASWDKITNGIEDVEWFDSLRRLI